MSDSSLLQEISLLVKPEYAQEVLNNGFAEIVFRQENKQFRNFVKAYRNKGSTNQEKAEEIIKALEKSEKNVLSGVQNVAENIELGKNSLSRIEKSINKFSNKFDVLSNLSKSVQALSFINAGLSLVNIAVDAAGFAHISNEMKGLSAELKKIEGQIEKLHDFSVEELRTDCEGLRMRYNQITDKLKYNKVIDLDILEDYLIETKQFISKLSRLLINKDADVEVLLNLIFACIPAYTAVLSTYLRKFYAEHKEKPSNYDEFLSVFQEINEESFKDTIQDYFLLERHFTYKDVTDILDIIQYSLYNANLEIEDQLKIIEALGDEEKYFALENMIEQHARKKFEERLTDMENYEKVVISDEKFIFNNVQNKITTEAQ